MRKHAKHWEPSDSKPPVWEKAGIIRGSPGGFPLAKGGVPIFLFNHPHAKENKYTHCNWDQRCGCCNFGGEPCLEGAKGKPSTLRDTKLGNASVRFPGEATSTAAARLKDHANRQGMLLSAGASGDVLTDCKPIQRERHPCNHHKGI